MCDPPFVPPPGCPGRERISKPGGQKDLDFYAALYFLLGPRSIYSPAAGLDTPGNFRQHLLNNRRDLTTATSPLNR